MCIMYTCDHSVTVLHIGHTLCVHSDMSPRCHMMTYRTVCSVYVYYVYMDVRKSQYTAHHTLSEMIKHTYSESVCPMAHPYLTQTLAPSTHIYDI